MGQIFSLITRSHKVVSIITLLFLAFNTPGVFGQANKYQVHGEALLDKINTKFYDSRQQLYVERIDANENIIVEGSGSSFIWPAAHMLRALKFGAMENAPKYTDRLRSYAYAIDKYKQNNKYASSTSPGATPFYDDNAIVGLALMDIYQKVLPGETNLMRMSLVGFDYCINARDNNWGVPQLESELGWGKFYSQGTILPALHSAMLAQSTNDPNYLNIAKRYYEVINEVGRKSRDANTNLINQYAFYENGNWSLTGHGQNGGGFRAYQTTPDIQLALKLYQITNNAAYLNDATVLADACLKRWYTPGKGLSEIAFWGGNDMVEMLVDFYEVDHNPKWLNAARDIADYLIAYGRDRLGYYAASESDAEGSWNLDRRNLRPASVSLMGQACAAAAMLRLAHCEKFVGANLAPGAYAITNEFSGKALGIKDGSTANNAPATTADNVGGSHQQWQLVKTADGYYHLTATHSNKALDVTACNTANGTLIQQYAPLGNDCQKFLIVDVGGGYFKLVSKVGLKCVDGGIAGAPNAPVYLWDQANASNQKWKFEKVHPAGVTTLGGAYTVQNRNSGLFLDVAFSSLDNGARLHQWSSNNGGPNQQFRFVHLGQGTYQIQAVHSGKSLDVMSVGTGDGAGVHQWDYVGQAHQQFIVQDAGNGYHRLIAKHSGKALEIGQSSTASGAYLQQWASNNSATQQWKLTPVGGGGGGGGFSTLLQAESFSASSDVFKENTSDAGGGQNVAGFDSNDWLAYYNVTFPTSGAYQVEYRVSSMDNNCRLSADLNAGAIQLGTLTVPNTGGWQNWTTVSHTVNVNAGTYNFGVFAQVGRWNINWLRISKAGGRAAAPAAAEASSKSWDIYPNPVVDQLHLSPALAQAGRQYRILNVLGRSVATGAVERNTLNVAALPAGVYTLEVVTQDQQKVLRRFVK